MESATNQMLDTANRAIVDPLQHRTADELGHRDPVERRIVAEQCRIVIIQTYRYRHFARRPSVIHCNTQP